MRTHNKDLYINAVIARKFYFHNRIIHTNAVVLILFENYWEYHTKTHTGEGIFEYSHCNKAFSNDICHKIDIKYLTGKGYSNEVIVTVYCIDKDSYWGKAYKYSHYEKGFTTKSNLKVHVRVHTREKQFQSKHCTRESQEKSDPKYIPRFTMYKIKHITAGGVIGNFQLNQI